MKGFGTKKKAEDKRGAKKAQNFAVIEEAKKALLEKAVVTSTPEELAEIKRKKDEEEKRRFIENNSTTLFFSFLNGEKKEVTISQRLQHYCEVQREIARLVPQDSRMFMCHYDNGDMIRPSEFKHARNVRVRELPVKTMIPKQNPIVDTKWDFLQYAGKPPKWKDPYEEKRRIEKEKRRKKEIQDRADSIYAELIATAPPNADFDALFVQAMKQATDSVS